MENDPWQDEIMYENNTGMWIIKNTRLTYSMGGFLAPEDETQRILY